MSVCNVPNIVNEHMRGYIDPQDLLALLKSLFPEVTHMEDFQLSVRFSAKLYAVTFIFSDYRIRQTRNRRWTFLAPDKVKDEDIRCALPKLHHLPLFR